MKITALGRASAPATGLEEAGEVLASRTAVPLKDIWMSPPEQPETHRGISPLSPLEAKGQGEGLCKLWPCLGERKVTTRAPMRVHVGQMVQGRGWGGRHSILLGSASWAPHPT